MLVYILELPWELGVPDDYAVDVIPASAQIERGECGLRFRTVSVRTQLPLAASDLAFGSLQQDGELDQSEKDRREERRRELTESPFLERRTVVAAYVPSEQDQPESDDQSLGKGLTLALDGLNAWLISLGVLYDDRLRPVAIGDLPPIVPVMPADMIDGQLVYGPSRLLPLRKYPEEIRTYGEEELEQAERMLGVVASEEALASFYEMIRRAGSARRADRHREAVIDYGTAGELFITALLEKAGERREIDPEKLQNLVAGPFKDRAMHLCRLLGAPTDPEDPDSPLFLWWLHCYRQRNWIVHQGADSMAMLSEAARLAAVQMVADIREAIRADSEIADLAMMIGWARRVDHTGGGNDSEPDPLPPRA